MALRQLTSEEKSVITIALNMRRCYIETGSTSLGARDLERLKSMDPKEVKRQFGAEFKALSEDQMRLILATRDLEKKMFSDQIYIDD